MTFNWMNLTPEQRAAARVRSALKRSGRARELALHHGPKIHRHRVAGLTWKQIGDILEISVRTAQNRYNRWLETEPEMPKRVSAEHRQITAWTLREHGFKLQEIADTMGSNVSTVASWIRRFEEG